GFRTGVLTNSWVDDGPGRLLTATLLQQLRSRFHAVLESCRLGMAKPEPGIFHHALEALQAHPHEV
ncbi:HYES hydrolase, partial [Spelaeornis formosus]|nr:HYES hydrolase [Elachura formosa]